MDSHSPVPVLSLVAPLDEQLEFGQLIERLRAGDADAAAELVRRYEPEVRWFVRFRLTIPTVRRWIDSLDVSQSVLDTPRVGQNSNQALEFPASFYFESSAKTEENASNLGERLFRVGHPRSAWPR